jgi:GAF domain-containing protein
MDKQSLFGAWRFVKRRFTQEMFTANKNTDRISNYNLLLETAKTFIEGETDLIALLSNLSALVKFYVDDLNWAGFYLLKGKELVLGPFQGLPACVRIAEGNGVCGKAVLDGKLINVPDVSLFPGHIACDSASVSELVIPVFKNGKIFGVLDLDSNVAARFTELEEDYLTRLAGLLSGFLDK